MNSEEMLALAGRCSDLPTTYEQIFKESLDRRGRPVKSLVPSSEQLKGEGR